MSVRIITGDCRDILPTLAGGSFDCVVTSPPYWGLRDYGVDGQIGLEPTLALYLKTMVGVFRELRRVLKPSGTAWLNIGDCYNAHPGQRKTTDKVGVKQLTNFGSNTAPSRHMPDLKPKDLMMVPNRLALLLQEDGWYIRSEIIWHKPSPMPESVRDRPTCAHEKVWLLTKAPTYFYDAEAIAEQSVYPGDNRALRTDTRKDLDPFCADGGSRARTGNPTGETRNARNVWTISGTPFSGAHYAVMPSTLAERCIKAGCPAGGSVLDPFFGVGTTGLVADRLGRHCTGIELNPTNVEMGKDRVTADGPLFAEVTS